MPKPKEPAEKSGGGWFDWWPRPVITSGTVLGAALLAMVSLGFVMVGLVFLLGAAGTLGLWSPVLGIVCFGVAGAIGSIAYRMLRRV